MATPNLTAINLSDKQGGEKFQMTPDEMKAIQKKMDDPEFMRLWAEYAQSLSDPKVREEEEAYLRQVEEEARSQGDYTMEFIFPRPVYAVELTNAPDAKRNHRVAINICESDKVERFREETTGNRRAANWFVPITVGAMRVETDPADSYKGQWEVYDAVFNPLTVSLANRDAKFMCFLTEIAVENINDGYKRRLGFEFQRLSSDVPSLGVPKNQTVRKAVPGSETAKRQAAAPVEVSLGPIKATLDSAARPAATPPPAKPAAANSAAPKPAPPAAGPQNKGVTFSVAHRGEIDLTDAWNWGKSDKRIGVPKELVVRATVPTVARAAELDVEVDGTAVDVQTEDGSVKGTAVLPFAVLPDPVSAKFDKSRRELTLVLAVVPPAAPADSAMSPSVDRRGDASSAASPEPKVPAGEEAREAAVAAEAARAAKVAQEAASAAEEAHRRERLAAAVRAQEDQKRKAAAAAAAPTATAAPVAAPTTAHELEQVRAKQDAWLKGLAAATAPVAAPVTAADPKPAAGSTPAAKHADPTPSASKSATTPSEAATLGAAPAPVSNTALPTTPAAPAAASSNLLLFDDDDEEDAAWLREADREAAGEREARKKRTAEQQAQEAEEQLRRVTRVLPLTSAHLFSID